MNQPKPLLGEADKFNSIIEIFAGKGYHSTTMDEIAQAIGVAKGTLYYHYKNKEELYYCVNQVGINILEQAINDGLRGETDPVAKIKILIERQLEFFNRYSHIAFIFLRELYGNNIRRDVLSGLVNRIIKIIEEILREGVAVKKFAVEDTETVATAIFGAISTTAIHYINQKGDIRAEQAQKGLEQLIFQGLTTSSQPVCTCGSSTFHATR